MKKRVTLLEVAKAADVSLGTASNALSGSGRTAEATADKVRAVARKLGYTPDPTISVAMSKIRQGRFSAHEETLAYITAYSRKENWHERYIINCYWEGALERATELGYRLTEYSLGDNSVSEARHGNILYNRGIRGLILAPHPDPDARLHLNWQHFATIAISRSIKEPVTHRVLDDHASIMRMTMRNLLARGYRRIGFAMNRHRVERTNRLWTGAYLAYQQELESENRIPMCITEAEHQRDPCGPALLDWFESWRPDAIVGIDLSDVEYLKNRDVRCPRDYGFAWINAKPGNLLYAGVVHNAHQVGRTAVSQLAGMLKNDELGLPKYPHVTLLGGYWQDGRSVRNPPKSTDGLSDLKRKSESEVEVGCKPPGTRRLYVDPADGPIARVQGDPGIRVV